HFKDGRPEGPPFDVVTGWLVDEDAWGRPVDALVGRDGALYLSDDRAGAIYRIYYSLAKQAGVWKLKDAGGFNFVN
ncbi:MAG TPA: hypothetical protein VII64_05160, partial [Thermodesulfobacteriota bacterium]